MKPDLDAWMAVRQMPRVERRPDLPYFVTSEGSAWTPIGHNDAVSWPELAGLFMRRDIDSVRRHLLNLRRHGTTCIRVMLEYAQRRHRYLEKPVGCFVPRMVQFWDDLFGLCEEVGIYLLLTPFDTFFTWRKWRHHPYNRANGGPSSDVRSLLRCAPAREAIKRRFEFATRRWGGSPALFAWDLWNELHPAFANDDPGACASFLADISHFLRHLELRVHGRAHLQTVTVFGPELNRWPVLCDAVYRHPSLDFVNLHLYEVSTIDDPSDTVAPARAAGQLMRAALREATPMRPVFDSEHGPIHAFIDRHRVLPEHFDDEYFRHIQWAHLASGGAGGGMRWPNRHPHVLTSGMRQAQQALAAFLPLIDWTRFRRRNLNAETRCPGNFEVFACGDTSQAVIWLMRKDTIGPDGTLDAEAVPAPACVIVPGLDAGDYCMVTFDTLRGCEISERHMQHAGGDFHAELAPVVRDVAIAVSRRDANGLSP